MKARLPVLLALCLATSACGPAPAPELAERESVAAVLERYQAHVSAGEVDEALRFYCEDVHWFEDGRLAYASADEVATGLRQAAQFGSVGTSFSDLEVEESGADSRWMSTTFTTTIGDPSSGGFSFGGTMTALLTATADGSWCARRGHTSTPSSESPAAD